MFIRAYTHIEVFRPLMFFTPGPTSAVVQTSLTPNKKTNKGLCKGNCGFLPWLEFSLVAESSCPEPFFVEIEAEHLPKAEVPSVHLFTHMHIGFMQYQHLFQVEFKCLRVSSAYWCMFMFMTRRY